jgi:hypothetical protein
VTPRKTTEKNVPLFVRPSNNNALQPSCQAVSSLDKDNILERTRFKIYPNCVKYEGLKKMPYKNGQKRIPRGPISKFSKKSRFRLFETLAMINFDFPVKPVFVSLTYHHGHRLIVDDNKTHLHHFLVSLRRYDPNIQYIWRIELQKRGAPHFHLIIFPSFQAVVYNEDDLFFVISSLWHDIADPKSRAHKEYGCKSTTINNYRSACAYVSKYLAKVPNGMEDVIQGKHWGCSRNLPFHVIGILEGNKKTGEDIIGKLRAWLLKNGKKSSADPFYFNIDKPQTVFIDSDKFYKLIGQDGDPPDPP